MLWDLFLQGRGFLFLNHFSIIPSLILEGVGETISMKMGTKIFILNGYNDRETSHMDALKFIYALTSALNRHGTLSNSPSSYITHLVYAEGSDIKVDQDKIEQLGIKTVKVASQ